MIAQCGTCSNCQKNKILRKCSALCYYCHEKAQKINDDKFDQEENTTRRRIREAYYALIAAWASDSVEREETAAFELIEAVENYLGKV